MCSDLVWFPWFLKRTTPHKFFLGTYGLLEPLMDSLLQNSAKHVVKHNHTLCTPLVCIFIRQGGRTMALEIIDSSALFLERWKGGVQWERVSQEVIWAPLRSPVSRLLNPVSTSTKREEAQPPTADISDSLYTATRWRMSLYAVNILFFNTAHCHFK